MDVFGGDATGIKLGLEQFLLQISGQITHSEAARYAAGIVFLERQLADRTDMLKTIRIGMEKAQAQAEYFDTLHENVLANLGDVYVNTISSLQPRIMVNGDERYLSRPDTVNKIRALLLAGIRSAVLWRQCGGARWKFLFYRGKLETAAESLLKKI
jgi:high frequency lysogenization protein